MWCFVIINNRPAEIYFEKKKGKTEITGHCYVTREEFEDKEERQAFDEDTAKYKFSYWRGEYKPSKHSIDPSPFPPKADPSSGG